MIINQRPSRGKIYFLTDSIANIYEIETKTIEFIPAIISRMWNWFHLPLKTCARLGCGERNVGGEFEKAFSKARAGNLLIVSSFVTKRATVFKYSVNGAESIGGKKFFHRGRLPTCRNFRGINSVSILGTPFTPEDCHESGQHLFRVSLRYRSVARAFT